MGATPRRGAAQPRGLNKGFVHPAPGPTQAPGPVAGPDSEAVALCSDLDHLTFKLAGPKMLEGAIILADGGGAAKNTEAQAGRRRPGSRVRAYSSSAAAYPSPPSVIQAH